MPTVNDHSKKTKNSISRNSVGSFFFLQIEVLNWFTNHIRFINNLLRKTMLTIEKKHRSISLKDSELKHELNIKNCILKPIRNPSIIDSSMFYIDKQLVHTSQLNSTHCE